MVFRSIGMAKLSAVRRRLGHRLATTRWDALAMGVMLPISVLLCWAWQITPSLAVGDYVLTHTLVTAIAIVPAFAIASCAGWFAGRSPQKLNGERGRSFMANLGLLLGVSWVYSHVKAGVALQPLCDDTLYRLDLWLCAGRAPWELVREWIPHAGFQMHLIYMSFFPVLIASIYWMTVFGSRQLANRFTCTLVIAYVVGALAYHATPSFGPFYYAASGSSEAVSLSAHRLQQLLMHHVQLVRTAGDSTNISPWKYLGAFPSLHVGHVLILCWFVRRSRFLLTLAAAYLLATMVSTTYLGWHYLADWVGGPVR